MRILKEIVFATGFFAFCLAIRDKPEWFQLDWTWVFITPLLTISSQLALGFAIAAYSLITKGFENKLKEELAQKVETMDNQKEHDPREVMALMNKYSNLGTAATKGIEDFIFVAPLMLLSNQTAIIVGVLISAILFVSSHEYGKKNITILGYVPIAYLVASNYGLLTIMFAHGLLDVVIYSFRKMIFRNTEHLMKSRAEVKEKPQK